jgi:PKD repeat protein
VSEYVDLGIGRGAIRGGAHPAPQVAASFVIVGNTIQCTDESTSSPTRIVTWHWEVFDSLDALVDQSQLQHPLFTGLPADDYDIVLTCLNKDGESDSESFPNTISDLTLPAPVTCGEIDPLNVTTTSVLVEFGQHDDEDDDLLECVFILDTDGDTDAVDVPAGGQTVPASVVPAMVTVPAAQCIVALPTVEFEFSSPLATGEYYVRGFARDINGNVSEFSPRVWFEIP